MLRMTIGKVATPCPSPSPTVSFKVAMLRCNATYQVRDKEFLADDVLHDLMWMGH